MASVKAAIVGSGTIAGPYARNLMDYPELTLLGVADLDRAKAEALAAKHGVRAYEEVAALLADPEVALVVNLTIHHAHHAVTKACLEAGKHVYSEKPLALSSKEAHELVTLAEAKGLRLACSPFTPIGEAQQTAWKLLREGRLGPVRLAYAEVNWGRIESWHPNPAPFYEVGALWDVGVYPLTLLTTYFGPAVAVSAFGTLLHPERVTKDGTPFSFSTPDFVVSMVEFASGALARLTTDFYAPFGGKQTGLELHGDAGSLYLSRWDEPNARLEVADFGQPYESHPLLRETGGLEWGRGARELAQAMLSDRPSRVTGVQAAHVVDILEAISHSMNNGGRVEIGSSFPPPEPMDWAL